MRKLFSHAIWHVSLSHSLPTQDLSRRSQFDDPGALDLLCLCLLTLQAVSSPRECHAMPCYASPSVSLMNRKVKQPMRNAQCRISESSKESRSFLGYQFALIGRQASSPPLSSNTPPVLSESGPGSTDKKGLAAKKLSRQQLLDEATLILGRMVSILYGVRSPVGDLQPIIPGACTPICSISSIQK